MIDHVTEDNRKALDVRIRKVLNDLLTEVDEHYTGDDDYLKYKLRYNIGHLLDLAEWDEKEHDHLRPSYNPEESVPRRSRSL